MFYLTSSSSSLYHIIIIIKGGILFVSIRYLIQLHDNDVEKGIPFDDSDDSELDELEYRNNNNNNNNSDEDDDNEGLKLLQEVKRLTGDNQKYSRSQFHSKRGLNIIIDNPLHQDNVSQFVHPSRNK